MGETSINPVTLELVRNGLESVVDEMSLIVYRTAYSGILRENMDFSTAFCDAKGQLVAQAVSIAVHLGSVPEAMDAILARYGRDLGPGDVIILNDPFEGGSHLPDIFMVKPVFLDGRLAGFTVTICHHTDVGGRVSGSNASDSTEIYAEGLRIPPLKLHEGGRPNETLLRLIEKNVRVPQKVLGDLRAQLSACHVGERQLAHLVARHGRETVERYVEALLDYTERLTRAEIAELPDGAYTFEDWIDDDGVTDTPIPLRVTITVAGDELVCDFTGSSMQVKGAINATYSFTKANVYATLKYVLGSEIPNNAGFFRPIRVVAPRGSILNAVPPAACAARGLTGFRLGDVMFGALAQAVPRRAMAAGDGGNSGIGVGGYDATRTPFIFVEFFSSNWGGRADRDGIDGNTTPYGNLANIPAEVVEAEHPLRLERYEFVPDSGGAGRFRGGLAQRREYRFLEAEAVLQIRSDRRKFRPFGLDGGRPGTPSRTTLWRGGEARELPTKVTMPVRRDDVFLHTQPGGGGFGDPFERDPERVLDDLRNEKISEEAARREYGVVVDRRTWRVDAAETVRLRATGRRRATEPPADGGADRGRAGGRMG